VIDQDLEHQIDLSGDFEYEPGSYQRGGLSYRFSGLALGEHNLSIKAWDNANNSSLITADVQVTAQEELKLAEVMNYPNPFSKTTNFSYRLSQDAARVEVKIFTLAGRLIREIPFASAQAGINYSTTWDGKDQAGDEVANGVYIYKITAEGTLNGKKEKTEALGKAVVVR
jgi:flagellar hook assembly protein FlgD